MATSPAILDKIKLLLKLAQSPNENEASNAREKAHQLISKHNVSEEELKGIAEKKSAYSEDELLFSTNVIVGWKNQLALGLATKFDCQIIQEECHPSDGNIIYNYYVYGADESIETVKRAYSIFNNKVYHLLETRCQGRGPIYKDSYCEGVVQSIRENLYYEDIVIPKPKINEDPTISNSSANLTVPQMEKEKPTEEKVEVSGQSLIKDIAAYFTGIADGRDISLQETIDLSLNNQEVPALDVPSDVS